MRQPARSIWESASRPLFVRSVWLERIGETGRSHRRHFILDYEPRERQRWIHCQRQSAKRGGASYQSESYQQLADKSMAIEDSVDYTLDEYLLLDATKLTLQRQQQVSQAEAAMANKVQAAFSTLHSRRHSRRRAWLLSSGKSYQLDHHPTDSHLHSRRSSLQDAQATSSTHNTANPEERLAERVINWLDLAGRADIVKGATPATPVTSSSAVLPGSQRGSRHAQRGMSLKRCATGNVAQRETPRKTVTKQSVVNYCSNPPSNAKPITIIFNKEGVPVRLNRPARNIDLCALSTSASTTRRLAGQLASARLYNGSAAAASTTSPTLEQTRTPPQSSRALTAKQQQLQQQQDQSRKQLHIFMPSLPKKGLLLAATTSSEDALSASFSDLYC